LQPQVALEAEGEISQRVGVELVALIAVGVGVLGLQVIEVRVAEGEGIALVGVVVAIDGVGVFGLGGEVLGHALPETDGEAPI